MAGQQNSFATVPLYWWCFCNYLQTWKVRMKTAQDFFVLKEVPCRQLMNNPPFKQIRLFIDHAFAIGDERLVLVCPERRWACMKGWQQFQRHKPARFLNLNWREDYLGKGGSPDRALAISIWESPNVSRCQCEVWSKPLELWLVKRRRRFILSSEKNSTPTVFLGAAAERKCQGMAWEVV